MIIQFFLNLSQHIPVLSCRHYVHVHHCITSLLSKVIDSQGENGVGMQILGENWAGKMVYYSGEPW
jgi:hypothetical protein